MQIQILASKLNEVEGKLIKYEDRFVNLKKEVKIKEYENYKYKSNLGLQLLNILFNIVICYVLIFFMTCFSHMPYESKVNISTFVTILYSAYMILKFKYDMNLGKQYSRNILDLVNIEDKLIKLKSEKGKYIDEINELFKNDLESELSKLDSDFRLHIEEDNDSVLLYKLINDKIDDEIIKEEVYKFRLNEEKDRIKVEKSENQSKDYMTNNEAIIYFKDLDTKILNVQEYKNVNKEFLMLEQYLALSKVQPDNSLIYSDFLNEKIPSLQSFRLLHDTLESVTKLLEYRKRAIKDEFKKLYAGYTGEQFVNHYLSLDNDKSKYINLSNIRLRVDESTIENDNIILSKNGIFVLEVKNMGNSGNYYIDISEDGNWYKVFRSGRESKVSERSPFEQNKMHIEGLEKIINNKLNRKIHDEDYIQVRGLVVMANDIVSIKNNTDEQVYRVHQINGYIDSFEQSLNDEELNKIKDIILSQKLNDAKQEYKNYKEEIENNIEAFKKITILGLEHMNILETILSKYMQYQDLLKEHRVIDLKINEFDELYRWILISKVEYEFDNIYEEKTNNINRFLEEYDDKALTLD